MKKFWKIGLCVTAAAMLAAGCGNGADKETETTAAVEETTAPETKSQEELTDEASITLGNYKGLSYTAVKREVTDEMVNTQLEALKAAYPVQVTDRAAKDGDVVNINFVGKKDGEAFEGGTSENYDLALGSGKFIEGFEEGVVGMMPGEEKDLNLTFPENYHSADLAGQPVVFTVTLNFIKDKENTQIDDALARRATGDMNATVESLTELVKKDLENQLENEFFNGAGNEMISQIVENSEITCDPDALEQMNEQLKSTYSLYAAQYGLDLNTFLTSVLGSDEEGLKVMAEDLLKQEMVIDAIIEAENIQAVDEEKESMARMNYFESADAMVEAYGEESADRLFQMGAAYYFLIDNGVQTEADEAAAIEETAAAAEETAAAAEETAADEATAAAEETAAEDETTPTAEETAAEETVSAQ